MHKQASTSVEPETLDTATLAFLAGPRANAVILQRILAAGFTGLRESHGFIFQHLLVAPRTVGEMAALLGVTQQAASKALLELETLGYVESERVADARVRRMRLSRRGMAAVQRTRRERARLEGLLLRRQGETSLRRARTLLTALLHELGGLQAVRERKVAPPQAPAL